MTSPDHIVRSQEPYNAEPRPERLRAQAVTAQADFYVRSHGDVPHLEAATHRLRIGGRVAVPLELTLEDLRTRFPEQTVEAVLQCAGNRRADLDAVAPVEGDPWAVAAIGNALWTGVSLADVLRAAGVTPEPGLHVGFSSLDMCDIDGKRFAYGASIPLDKALSPEVLLAYAMNGEPLAPEHGYPLRVVTPGFAGVRSPKWLAAIEIRDRPSDNPIQAEDYKLLPPDIRSKDEIDWSCGDTIDAMPVTSAICTPSSGDVLAAGLIPIRGYAVAAGRGIASVDVSVDDGRTWRSAALQPGPRWSWTFWSLDVELPPGRHGLLVRATDADGETQPEDPRDVWNIKGYLSRAWHRLEIVVQ